jgi:hypothetical protein
LVALGVAGCPEASAPAPYGAVEAFSLGPLAVYGEDPAQGSPLFAVYERGRHASRLDNETPKWVVYADGKAITPDANSRGDARVEGRVGDPAALGRTLVDLLRGEPEHRRLKPLMLDLPITEFFVRSEGGWIRRAVEGLPVGCRPPASALALERSCALLRSLAVEEPRPWSRVVPNAAYLERVRVETESRYVNESQARSAAARRRRAEGE